MRLQPAIPIESQSELSGGFGDREERRERRAERVERRASRKSANRRERARRLRARARAIEAKNPARAARLRARADKLDPKAKKGGGTAASPAPAQLQPLQPAAAPPSPGDFPAAEPTELDDFLDEGDLEAEEGGTDPLDLAEVEGVGWSWPGRRNAVATRWSPPAAMGPRIRIQAAAGFRAAVIELKPGLFIVAEVPERATRPAFGLAPLLAPLVVRAARRAMDEPAEPTPRRHPLAALFQPRQEQKALPGPVAEPAPPDPATAQAAAAVGRWVGADDLAGVIAQCEGCRSRR